MRQGGEQNNSGVPEPPPVVGVVLAGGAGRRMGGVVKPLLALGDETLVGRIFTRARPQVHRLAVSVHHVSSATRQDFAAYDAPLLADPPQLLRPDDKGGRVGPLAGVLAALSWAEQLGFGWLVTFPGDTPFIPEDYAQRLYAAVQEHGAPAAYAVSGDRRHPIASIWSVELLRPLWKAVMSGERRVGKWLGDLGAAEVCWSGGVVCGAAVSDPFFNINEPQDLELARQSL